MSEDFQGEQIDIDTKKLSSFWWRRWCNNAREEYKPKNHEIHFHWMWYIITENVKTANKNLFKDFVEKYKAGKTLPDNVPADEFVKLVFGKWKKDKSIQGMLQSLGIIDKFIKLTKDHGYTKKWPTRMLC